MVELSRRYDFAFFSHWMTDVIGHRGGIEDGVKALERFDAVMAGALAAWDDREGLLIVTSDHGNMEDLSHGKHTENDVPDPDRRHGQGILRRRAVHTRRPDAAHCRVPVRRMSVTARRSMRRRPPR